ncbi:Golgi-associated plant pathogenesis-related protein 1-like isoform X1 [Dreissena polymorpha]|uniref:Golgi-associated plant pathogenesis-related protein 1-like isoform X1 n=1 Tax=Dreissena polymorpha TaxID=45954 RepID=UPI002264306A|nr:Golgi-associated plant pathogenesis-related protein 1-like isoform X1 [Dreissena polymorpha]
MSNSKFIEELIKAHNEYRAKHQASPLKHAQDLSDYAQNWANHLIATNSFEHSNCDRKGQRLGENIASKWSSSPTDYTGQEPTDAWYSEIAKYDFNEASFKHGTGHFTQVVWKGSQEIGAARATDGKGKWIAVASYRPAGNMMGDFARNVLPPKDGKIIIPAKKVPEMTDNARNTQHHGGGEGRQTKSYTRTKDGVTTTYVEETIVNPDGSRTTKTHTTTTNSSR